MTQALDTQTYRLLLTGKLEQIKRNRLRREDIAIENAADAVDQRQLSAARDMAVTVIEYESQLARDVADALQRLNQGTYGFCEECDSAIAKARLDVLPWTRFCRDCQARLEQGGVEPHGRRDIWTGVAA